MKLDTMTSQCHFLPCAGLWMSSASQTKNSHCFSNGHVNCSQLEHLYCLYVLYNIFYCVSNDCRCYNVMHVYLGEREGGGGGGGG